MSITDRSCITLLAILTCAITTTTASAQDLYSRYHNLLYDTLAQPNTTINILSGPTSDYMNRGTTGQQWLAEGFGYQFKITIENGTGVDVQTVANTMQALPEPYFQAYAEVSEVNEDGVAIYLDLDGAWGHGGQDYLNFVPDAIYHATVIAHEAGHCLEQMATELDPTIPAQWQAAVATDPVSVSAYGDTYWAEDVAEFAMIYALCMDGGPTYLAELQSLSPQRYELWESILDVQSTIPVDIEGDLNNDGYVGLDDLDIILNNWNHNVRDGYPSDPSGDNYVGLDDLDIVLNNWNNGTPPSAQAIVPEPATIAMMLLSGTAVLRRK